MITRTCEARGWECHIEHTTIGEVMDDMLDASATPCSLCARLRRGVLYRLATGRRDQDRARPPPRRLHRDAAAEPVLRRDRSRRCRRGSSPTTASTSSSGRSSTSPKPRRAPTRRSARCRSSAAAVPACGDLSLQRQRIKRLIAELEVEHPDIKNSMIKALGNVAPRHLLDTPPESAARAARAARPRNGAVSLTPPTSGRGVDARRRSARQARRRCSGRRPRSPARSAAGLLVFARRRQRRRPGRRRIHRRQDSRPADLCRRATAR